VLSNPLFCFRHFQIVRLIMWKPGSSKPRTADGNDPLQATNSTPALKEQEDTSSSSQQKTRQLSGLTMNMKFMKRKIDEQENHRRHSHDGMIHRQSDPEEAPSSLSTEPYLIATSTDMYCYNNLLGRRSFGNFNKFMESAWTACYDQSKQSNSRHSATDEELLQRYKDFGRRKAVGNDIDDRPVKRSKRRAKQSL
jgi:hypothetical protein